jgi:hypothetical protein
MDQQIAGRRRRIESRRGLKREKIAAVKNLVVGIANPVYAL